MTQESFEEERNIRESQILVHNGKTELVSIGQARSLLDPSRTKTVYSNQMVSILNTRSNRNDDDN